MQGATEQREVVRQAVASDPPALSCGSDPMETKDILNDAEARTRQTGRTLIAEVDRRPALRAR